MISISKQLLIIIYKALCLVLLLTNSIYSQELHNIDKLVRTSTIRIYENPDEVIKIGKRIVAQSGSNVDNKIKGLKLIADAYSSKRDYEKSLEYVIKANQLLYLSKNELLKIEIINKTGIQFHQLKIFDKALQFLDQAEQMMAKYPAKDSIHSILARNYVVRGFIYKEKLNSEIAIEFFNKGILELANSKNQSDNTIISIAKYNKGNCYFLLSNNVLARKNYMEAYAIAKKDNATSLMAFPLKGLAEVYYSEEEYNKSIELLLHAMNISKGVNDLVLNNGIYLGLSKSYLALNQWEKFKVYNAKYNNNQKIIEENEHLPIGNSLQEKEIEYQKQLKNDMNKLYAKMIMTFIITLMFVLFVAVQIKKKKLEILNIKTKIQKLQDEKTQ